MEVFVFTPKAGGDTFSIAAFAGESAPSLVDRNMVAAAKKSFAGDDCVGGTEFAVSFPETVDK